MISKYIYFYSLPLMMMKLKMNYAFLHNTVIVCVELTTMSRARKNINDSKREG